MQCPNFGTDAIALSIAAALQGENGRIPAWRVWEEIFHHRERKDFVGLLRVIDQYCAEIEQTPFDVYRQATQYKHTATIAVDKNALQR